MIRFAKISKAMGSRNKRRTFQCQNGAYLGIYALDPTYQPIFVSDRNADKFIKFSMANGVETKDETEAKNILLQRDQKEIFDLPSKPYFNGILGPIFMPPSFLSKIPNVLKYEEFHERRQRALELRKKGNDQVYVPKDHLNSGELPGEMTEREMFDGLKRHLESSGDDCLVLHAHSFLCGNNFQEKDFIVLNLSRGYIMIIEAKVNTKRGKDKKAMEQIKDGRMRVQKLINSVKDVSNQWKFIGVFYVKEGSETDFQCSSFCPCREFTIVTQSSIPSKLFNIDFNMEASHPDWNPRNHVNDFTELTKQLIFTFQGNPEAPILGSKVIESIGKEMDKACTIENIFFWTPEQLSILNAINEDFMVLFAYYGCGKTLLLKERAKYLLSQSGDQEICFFVNSGCDPLLDALSASFENTRIHVGRLDSAATNGERIIRCTLQDGFKKNCHLIIDEMKLWYENIDELILSLKKLKAHFSSVWIAIGGLGTSFIEVNPALIRSEIKKIPMCCPTFKHCLRNSRKILDLAMSAKSDLDTLSILSNELETNNVNDGCVKELELQSNWINALELGLEHMPFKTEFVIVVKDQDLTNKPTFEKIKRILGSKEVTNLEDNKQCREYFMLEDRSKSIAIIAEDIAVPMVRQRINGLEFDSLLWLAAICSKCNNLLLDESLVTRAKVMLIFATYISDHAKANCSKCNLKLSSTSGVK